VPLGTAGVKGVEGPSVLVEPVAAGCSDSDSDDEDDEERGRVGVDGELKELFATAPNKLPDFGVVGVVPWCDHEGPGYGLYAEGPSCLCSGVRFKANGGACCGVEADVLGAFQDKVENAGLGQYKGACDGWEGGVGPGLICDFVDDAGVVSPPPAFARTAANL